MTYLSLRVYDAALSGSQGLWMVFLSKFGTRACERPILPMVPQHEPTSARFSKARRPTYPSSGNYHVNYGSYQPAKRVAENHRTTKAVIEKAGSQESAEYRNLYEQAFVTEQSARE